MTRVSWTEEMVIAKVKEIYGSGKIHEIGSIQKEEQKLYQAGLRKFGNWDSTLRASGFNPDNFRKMKSWDKETILSELKRIYEISGELSPTYMNANGHSSIPVISKKLFGSYEKAISEAGFDVMEVFRKKNVWTDAEVKEYLLRVFDIEGTFSQKLYRNKYRKLISIAHSKYGGWYRMLKHFDLPTEEVKTQWDSSSQVISEIRSLKESGEGANPSSISNSLYLAAKRKFGSWDAALEASGLDPDIERVNVRWDRDKLLKRLKDYAGAGYNLSWSSILSLDSALAHSFKLYYDSWDDFLKDAGLFNKSISEISRDKISLGFRFQKVLKEILTSIGISFKYETTVGKYRPDFILNNNTLIDAKLSSWTALCDGTLRKYSEICDKLIIIYLRGNDIESNDFVTFIHIDDFSESLIKKGREDLVRCITDLKSQLDELESSAS